MLPRAAGASEPWNRFRRRRQFPGDGGRLSVSRDLQLGSGRRDAIGAGLPAVPAGSALVFCLFSLYNRLGRNGLRSHAKA